MFLSIYVYFKPFAYLIVWIPLFLSITHFSLVYLFFLLICKSPLYVICYVCLKYDFSNLSFAV